MTQSTQSSARPVELWRDKLASSDTLVFTRTVSDVNVVALDDLTSASDLSQVIGHDVSMAARLLRIASSALFNRQGRTVNTINTAIVRIGFDAIRELAISLALIEQVLNGHAHAQVTKTMARAFHAATQAKALSSISSGARHEEVFAAALLFELGAMLFWAAGSEEGVVLETLHAAGAPEAEAEMQALGFSLFELSSELADEWHLGDLLKAALHAKGQPQSTPLAEQDSGVRSVLWGHEIASLVELRGWESTETHALLEHIANELDLDVVTLQDLVQGNFREAGDIAERYGVPKLNPVQTPAKAGGAASAQPAPAPNPQSQIEILQEIGDAINQGRSLNDLVALILKGIYQGLGFDRTYFALLSPDRSQLQSRYVLGNTPQEFLNSTHSFLPQGDLFAEALHSGTPALLTPEALALRPEYRGWLAYSACAIMPIVVQGKPIGVLYGDRAISQIPLDDQAYRGFQLFGQQLATVVLSIRNADSAAG